MRPQRLQLSGFGVFRDPTEIDFVGADLFALSGATGAGKSTVIDAIVFALYGVVPRYGDKRLVGVAVSQGKLEARVRVDFSVGADQYTVVRVVRISGKNATASTPEARLERRGGDGDDEVEVLAGTADEVTAAVERLLGLTYEHFTTCVVLPQGDFQRFLHQKPAARQDLLVELLDLGVYGRMAQLARGRAQVAGQQRVWVDQQVEELGSYSPEMRAQLEADLDALAALLARIDAAQPELDALAARAGEAQAAADAADARAVALAGVQIPADLADLAEDLRQAEAAEDQAVAAEELAATQLSLADAGVAALPDRAVLDQAARAHDERAKELGRIATGEDKLVGVSAAAVVATAAVEAATTAHLASVAALEDARRTNRAHEFAAVLAVGEPCPVCLQAVEALPDHDLGDLEQLTRAEQGAAQVLTDALAAARDADAQHTRYVGLLADLRERVAALDTQLVGHPDPVTITGELARIDAAQALVDAARAAEKQAIANRKSAAARVKALGSRAQVAWLEFDEARDRVAVLGPPAAARTDVLADWEQLAAWAAVTGPAQHAEAEAQRRAVAAADADRQRVLESLRDACAQAGVDPAGRPPRDVVIERLADAKADLESLAAALERLGDLRADQARLVEAEQVAAALGTHLKANAIEKWVLDDVLQRLVASATEILFGLSGGTYSLSLDSKGFAVRDHANADAVRSARSLSGGETFLASLALALALADEIAQLAAGGTVRLESIFLDEGFGTLDPDTLDTVADALEELGARGRMVGIVTHVHDLAERLPTRYEVSKAGNTSAVTRVDA